MRQFLVRLCVAGLCLLSWPGWPAAGEPPRPELRGRVSDAEQQAGLPGATVVLLGTQFGTNTGEDGRFVLGPLPAGRYDVLVTYIGYRSRKVEGVRVEGRQELEITLEPTPVEMPGVVVSATRRSQSFTEAPISMSVAEAHDLAPHNAFSLSGPLRYVPGVSLIGSQVNVRGSSGYSQGTGSRVLLLLDGFPVLSADSGDIKWDIIPVPEVERVEVVKGAGSALYGTGALGGVINVITRQPSPTPQVRFRVIGGFFDQPAYRSWRWTDDLMYVAGADASYSTTLGRTGVLLAAGHKQGTGYHENDRFDRYNAYAKSVHHFTPATYWGTLVDWARDDHGVFVQWNDRLHPLEVRATDEGASTVSEKLNVNSEFYHLHGRSLGVRLKGFMFRTDVDNTKAAGGLRSVAYKLGTEAQADLSGWERFGLTAGGAGMLDRVRSPGDFLGQRNAANWAVFSQAVYKLLPQAEVAVGMRYDWHRRDQGTRAGEVVAVCPSTSLASPVARTQRQFSPQVGLSYFPRPGTSLRASAGRGFRAPSVTEVFIQAEVSGVLICPNPSLHAERSWSYEVGAKQLVGKRMAVDLALFWNAYNGLVEGRPDPSLGTGQLLATFRNLSRARIRGLELESQLALVSGLRWRVAYTFLDAVEFLARDEVLPPYGRENLVPGEQGPLPFRSRHQLVTGLAATRGPNQAGLTFQYRSRFARMTGLVPEGTRDSIPVWLADAYLGRQVGLLQLTLRVDNLLQYHYVLVERQIQPLRQWTLSVSGAL